jgi:phosphoribosylformimino-5-aminoimidazole carboxamide ribotide isomerase
MKKFTIYPAIDLRQGKVVRLVQGDPERQTTYSQDPRSAARRWLDEGAAWLHVVNLDGAFDERGASNWKALASIVELRKDEARTIKVQFGGGLRALDDIARALGLGVDRVILGTAAVENPKLARKAFERFGAEKIAIGIDARDGLVRTHGWQKISELAAIDLARNLRKDGCETIIFTNIQQDGTGEGVDLQMSTQLATIKGLEVIASGGVATIDDVRAVRETGLPGLIVGRALYEGSLSLGEALQC